MNREPIKEQPILRCLKFTAEEKELIHRAMKSIHGMRIYRAVFYHDAIIEKAQKMLEEAENNVEA